MKVFDFFAHVVAIFVFLTFGSLFIIVALHLISFEDAVLQLQELYATSWNAIQTGFLGLIFVFVGLLFTRMLLKKRRSQDALIYQGENGPIVVSMPAMEDVVKKAIKRFHLVKEAKTKILIHGKEVEVRVRLILWSGIQIPELLAEVQEEIKSRLGKMLGGATPVEVSCDVLHIQEHDTQSVEQPQKVLSQSH